MNYQSFYRSPFAPRVHFDEGMPPPPPNPDVGAKPWFDGVDAETVGHWDNKGWKKDDPKALATELTKAWKGLEKHFGAPADQILKLPKDNADEAGWAAVRQRLGMPKEAKEYDFSGVKRADGKDVDPSFTDTMRNALHKAGTAKDAAPDIVKAVVGHLDAQEQAKTTERTTRLQADRTALQTEWGQNFEFNRLTAMQGAKRAVGTDEGAAKVVAAMEESIGYKATMEFWRKIGAGTNEDTFVDAQKDGNPTTRNGAAARIKDLEGDPEWVKRYLSGGAKEKQEMGGLLVQMHGVAA